MKPNLSKIKLVKGLCSLVIYEIVYNKGFLRRRKVAKLKIWYTLSKIHIIEILDHRGYIMVEKNPFDCDFKEGDKISDVLIWANENNLTEAFIRIQGKGNRTR
jgi:hypothetical protein